MRLPDRPPVLDPLDRTTEAMFGLLMALTFTGAASVLSADDPRQVVAAALGCNLAWGFTDAVIYLLSTAIGRGRRRQFLVRLQTAPPAEAEAMVREGLADWGPDLLPPGRGEAVTGWLRSAGPGAAPVGLEAADYRAALAVFLSVVVATFPPVLPLLLIDDIWVAMRVSNLVSLLFLMVLGLVLDNLVGRRWRFGLLVPVMGGALVAVIVALGG